MFSIDTSQVVDADYGSGLEEREDYLDPLLYGSHDEDILFEWEEHGPHTMPYAHDTLWHPKGPGNISREMIYDTPLDYMLKCIMVANPPLGMYVYVNAAVSYYQDAMTGEYDSELYGENIRPSYWCEIREAHSFWAALKLFPLQLVLQWKYAQGLEFA